MQKEMMPVNFFKLKLNMHYIKNCCYVKNNQAYGFSYVFCLLISEESS